VEPCCNVSVQFGFTACWICAETTALIGAAPAVENDGILTAEDVSTLDLQGTWLVTLSACDTGAGEQEKHAPEKESWACEEGLSKYPSWRPEPSNDALADQR
jgi:hypothetical protein